jgi:small GTP-binding protein
MSAKLPVVSIVGRQNVGKSTLFNALIKDKKSIVDSFPGLTRDVISHTIVHDSVSFVISDTPGLDLASSSELSEQILEGARKHLARSSVIVLLLESPGPESFDFELASIVRKMVLPTIVAVNKMDSAEKMENMSNFYELGFTEIIPVSALRRFNISMMLDNIVRLLPVKKTAVTEPDLKIAVIGRPNSGKSTLLNSFMGYERSVVSDIPGTTRDSVDETFTYHGKTVQIIDTAGIRKKSKIAEYKDKLIFKFYRAEDFPIISVSAKNKQRIDKLLQTAFSLHEKANKRIDTPTLNRVISELKSVGRIPQLGEKIRVYYAVQINTVPPSFRFFVNNAEHFRKDVVRYFEKALKEALDLEGLPIVIQIEGKNRNDGRRKPKS